MVCTNEQLLANYLDRGCQKSFDELFRRHNWKLIRGIKNRHGYSLNHSEEAVQMAWLHIVEKSEQCRECVCFVPWMMQLCAWKAHKLWKAARRNDVLKDDADDYRSAPAHETVDLVEAVQKALQAVTPQAAEIFMEVVAETERSAAHKYALSHQAVNFSFNRTLGEVRRALGIESSTRECSWPNEHVQLLGSMSDYEVARRLNRPHGTVRGMRLKMGIAPFKKTAVKC